MMMVAVVLTFLFWSVVVISHPWVAAAAVTASEETSDDRSGSVFEEGLIFHNQSDHLSGIGVGHIEKRIIGGIVTRRKRFSYMADFHDEKGHFCGGSVIAPDVILTAAHCIISPDYTVVVGRHNLARSRAGQLAKVQEELFHPRYKKRTDDNDACLIILKEPVTPKATIVKLNSSPAIPLAPGEPVTALGWGDVVADRDVTRYSNKLRQVQVQYVPNDVCRNSEGIHNGSPDSYKHDIFDSMMCAAASGKDACRGDSGGPLVILGIDRKGANDLQVGISSWGLGCASEDFPGVYTRVSYVFDWIRSVVCEKSQSPPDYFQCGEVDTRDRRSKKKKRNKNKKKNNNKKSS